MRKLLPRRLLVPGVTLPEASEVAPTTAAASTDRRAQNGESPPRTRWRRMVAIVLLTVLCPFAGGALWGPPATWVAMALIFWIWPPQRGLAHRAWPYIFLGLVLLATLAFLPVGWFHVPAWRIEASSLGLKLPGTLSPQPWLTFDGVVQLIGGLAWAYYLCVQRWTLAEHRLLARLLAGGLLLLTVLALVLWYFGVSVPFWISERNFGPFANRNHTANFIALGGILALACTYDAFARSKLGMIGWALGTVLGVVGLIQAYSKAGVAMFFVGAFVWMFVLSITTRNRLSLVVGQTLILCLLAFFFFKGGETLQRFGVYDHGIVQTFKQDSRWALQRDVLAMGRDTAWCGLGLGNFAGVIPQYRKASYNEKTALNPESDWLWVRSELGWGGVLLLVSGLALWGRQIMPLRPGTNQRIRVGAAVGVLVFCLHGFVNPSGHRLGTLLPALLFASLALHPRRDLPGRPWAPATFRGIGIFLAVWGSAHLFSILNARPLPGEVGVQMLKSAAKQQYRRGRFEKLVALADRGLQTAPLDWELRYLRAAGLALSRKAPAEAHAEFRRARFLVPNAWKVAYLEGACWLQVAPAAALEPWTEALSRGGNQPPSLYTQMLEASRPYLDLSAGLRQLAGRDVSRQIALMAFVQRDELDGLIARLRQQDPHLEKLTPEQRESILTRWFHTGNRAVLREEAARRPLWQKAIWPLLAGELAKEPEQAYRFARPYILPPKVFPTAERRDLENLQKEYLQKSSDLAAGYRLFRAQQAHQQPQAALATIRELTGQKDCPSYLHFLEAELAAELGQWPEAWRALQRYAPELR